MLILDFEPSLHCSRAFISTSSMQFAQPVHQEFGAPEEQPLDRSPAVPTVETVTKAPENRSSSELFFLHPPRLDMDGKKHVVPLRDVKTERLSVLLTSRSARDRMRRARGAVDELQRWPTTMTKHHQTCHSTQRRRPSPNQLKLMHQPAPLAVELDHASSHSNRRIQRGRARHQAVVLDNLLPSSRRVDDASQTRSSDLGHGIDKSAASRICRMPSGLSCPRCGSEVSSED